MVSGNFSHKFEAWFHFIILAICGNGFSGFLLMNLIELKKNWNRKLQNFDQFVEGLDLFWCVIIGISMIDR